MTPRGALLTVAIIRSGEFILVSAVTIVGVNAWWVLPRILGPGSRFAVCHLQSVKSRNSGRCPTHCPSCGQESLIKDERFCEACGRPLNAGSQNSDQAASPLTSASLPQTLPEMSSAHRTTSAEDTQSRRGSARWQQLGSAAVAVLLYLSIADTAVETFLSQSPLRWWVVGAAVLYLALCVAVWRVMPKLWRRLSWANQAGFSLIVLLALMSATAWMQGGLEQGLNFFRQPTSIVLAVVSAIMVALSGIFLARLRFVPLAGKIVVGLLAAYGVMAFLLALNAGTPYSSLFHGGSEWTRLPSWLQGATVGCLFLVPLALVLEIVTGLRQITRDKISDFTFKVVALGMSLLITVAAVRTPASFDSGGGGNPTWLPDGHERQMQGEAGYKQASEKLNRMYAGLDVINSKMDRSLFEIDALAARLGSDPAAMFHFVRDEIRYEPYTGVLRGALGTLICRAGSSLDRSLLLAALLEKAGLKTQIASGQLTAQQAQILVNRLFEPVKPVPSAAPSLAELAPDLSRAVGGDQAKLLRVLDEMQAYSEKQKKELVDYVDNETGFLSNLFNKAGVDAGVTTPNDQLLAEAGEHYWVQYQNSDGQWVDMDSAFGDAEPGKTAVSAANTFASDAVPEELYHHLHVSLTLRVAQVENGNDTSADDTVLLDQEIRVAEQQGKDISLANIPVPMPDLTRSTVNIAVALVPARGYQTVLQIGSQTIQGKYFDLDGRLSDKFGGPAGDVVNNAGGVGGSVGGLGGGIGGSLGGDTSQTDATRIVGEWVDYKLISPRASGRSPVVRSYHRDIVAPATIKSWRVDRGADTVPTNLGKDALRRQLLWVVELLPVTGAAVPGYAAYLQLQAVMQNRQQIDALAKVASGLTSDLASQGSPRLPIANTLLFTGTIQIANSLARAQLRGLRSYFGQAGLIAFERAGTVPSSRAELRRGYDIVAYEPRVIADPASNIESATTSAASLRITHGVLATRLEWALVRAAGAGKEANVLNTTAVFAAAHAQRVPIIILRPGAGAMRQIAGLSLSDSVKAELSESLEAGNTLVLPTEAPMLGGQPELGWWRFHDASGELIGVMPGGRGQAATEYGAVVASSAICMIEAYSKQESRHESQQYAMALCMWGASIGLTGLLLEDEYLIWVQIVITVEAAFV